MEVRVASLYTRLASRGQKYLGTNTLQTIYVLTKAEYITLKVRVKSNIFGVYCYERGTREYCQ